MEYDKVDPSSVRAIHPKYESLDGYYPAVKKSDGEIWFADFLICSTEEEAIKMSAHMLNTNPPIFSRMTVWKATDPAMEQLDYVGNIPERPSRISSFRS